AALRAVPLAMRADSFQFFLQARNAPPDFAAVDLKLRLAGAAQAYPRRTAPCCATTRLPREVRPLACQARQAVFVLRQFNLQRTFAGARVLRKDLENQRGTIDHLHVF